MTTVHPFAKDPTISGFYNQTNEDAKNTNIWTTAADQKKSSRKDNDDQSLKEEMTDFANDISILGMKQIVNPKFSVARRLVWVAFVLAGTGFLIYHVWNRVSYYLENPASVDIKFNYNATIIFPTVTICNNNRFKMSSLAANGDLPLNDFFDFTTGPPNLTNIDMDQYNWTAFYMNNEYTLTDLVPYVCMFNLENCGPADFNMVKTELGSCIQFNGEGDLKSVFLEGSTFGFLMFLSANQYEYTPSTIYAGFTIALHNRGEKPQMERLGIRVAPGEAINIAIRQTRVTNLPEPHGQCKDKVLKYFDEYTKLNCLDECIMNYTFETCKCRMTYHPEDVDLRVCHPRDIYGCAHFNSTTAKQVTDACGCTEACKSTYFTHSVSHSKLGIPFMNRLATLYGTPVSTFEQNSASLSIFYSDISVEEVIQQEAYSTLTLFADIGGALGLVLGSTLMTVAEIVDFFIGVSFWKLLGVKI